MRLMFLCTLFVLSIASYSQNITGVSSVTDNYLETYDSPSNVIPLNFSKPAHFPGYSASEKEISKAMVYVELKFDGDPTGLNTSKSYTLLFKNGPSISFVESFILELKENQPKAVFYKDITDEFANIDNIELQNDVTGLNVTNISINLYYVFDYKLDASAYRVNPREPSNVLDIITESYKNRVQNFYFRRGIPGPPAGDFYHFPGYELQLLRVFNQDATVTEPAIKGEIDWSNAMKFNIENRDNFLLEDEGIEITVAEGTGMYAWRVRPVGNFHPGFFANDANYGDWSINYSTFDFADMKNPGAIGYFYLEDPDEDKNWIYSRTFSEGNKVSESMGYANTLLQRKQTQTYLPSQDKVFITQSIYDYKGRPALNTLPVPKSTNTDKRLEGYQSGEFIPAGETGPYRDKDFDGKRPERMETMPNNLGTGYYINNPGAAIGNSGKLPFTVTRFENDGTSRVSEESGVGTRHMIDYGNKTVKYDYGVASDAELVVLFGDEAPKGDKIKKTTVYDQNGVSTITYTNLDGKVIATALSYNDNDGFNGVNPDDDSYQTISVDQVLKVNTANEDGHFISTKRLSFTENTAVTISYKKPDAINFPLCGTSTAGECNYNIKVVIHNLDDPSLTIESEEVNVDDLIYDGNGCAYFTDCDFTYRQSGNPYLNPSNTTTICQDIAPEFETGSYLVEKIIIPQKTDNSALINEAVSTVQERVKSIVDQLISELDLVETEVDYMNFIDKYEAQVFEYYEDPNPDPITGEIIWSYLAPVDALNDNIKCGDSPNGTITDPDYSKLDNLAIDPSSNFCMYDGDILVYIPKPAAGEYITTMYVISECCKLAVPIEYIPTLSCPTDEEQAAIQSGCFDPNSDCGGSCSGTCDGSACDPCAYSTNYKADEGIFYGGTLNSNVGTYNFFNYGYVDYFLTVLHNLGEISTNDRASLNSQDIITIGDYFGDNYTISSATDLKDFDEMIFHMLNDIYGPKVGFDEQIQFDCDELAECWMGAIRTVMESRNVLDDDPDAFSQNNPVDEMNDEEDGEVNFDPRADIEAAVLEALDEMGWPMKWFIGKKKRQEMIDEAIADAEAKVDAAIAANNPIEGELNVVDAFLDCAGRKYARTIVTVTPVGGETADDILRGGCRDFSTVATMHTDIASSLSSDYDSRDGDVYGLDIPAFYRIFGFKYYNYHIVQGTLTIPIGAGIDIDVKSRKENCEIQYCFCPPAVDPCAGVSNRCDEEFNPHCGYGLSHYDWTFETRNAFRVCIGGEDGNNNVEGGDGFDFDNLTCAEIQEEPITMDDIISNGWTYNALINHPDYDIDMADIAYEFGHGPDLDGDGHSDVMTSTDIIFVNALLSITSPNPAQMELQELFLSTINGFTWKDVKDDLEKKTEICTTFCSIQTPKYKQQVLDMFQTRCWDVVSFTCSTYEDWEVPMSDVDKITSSLISHCEEMCKVELVGGYDRNCEECDHVSGNTSTRQWVEIVKGSEEEIRRWNTVMNGYFELDIATWCGKTKEEGNPDEITPDVTCTPTVQTDEIRNTTNLDFDVNLNDENNRCSPNTTTNTIYNASKTETEWINLEVEVVPNP